MLFLGRLHHLTQAEIDAFLSQYDMSATHTLDDSVGILIESSMIHPDEEEISYKAYKKKIPSFTLAQFEAFYAQNISSQSLLMALKLSDDQDRIIRTLKNEAIDDELYLKVLKLYDWGNEGIYDNDQNRDVTLTFIKRFFKVDHFLDPATIYSPITLTTILSQTSNPLLLETALSLPNYHFKVSRHAHKRPQNIRQIVALNPHTPTQTLERLLNYNDPQIDYFLAQNPAIDSSLQATLFARAPKETRQMLAQNPALSDALFEKLLDDPDTAPTLLAFATIDADRFALAKESEAFFQIAQNETIAPFESELLAQNDPKIDLLLASNPAISTSSLQTLYERDPEALSEALCQNPNLPSPILIQYESLNDPNLTPHIAQNPATPSDILTRLFHQNDFEIHRALALNPTTPIEILQQLQLDNRLMTYLSKNRTFTDKILNNLGIG